MNSKNLRLLAAALLLCGALRPIAAEENISIPEITIQADALSSDTVPTLMQKANDVNKVMGGASVVDTEVTRRGRSSTVSDALKLVPGVYSPSRFGAEEARLSIRGSGLQRTFHGRGIKVLQDGAAINLADGGFDFQALDPLSTRYIEVYRGANALEFGAANLGGAINYVSRNGRNASPFQARYEGGSFGYNRAQVSSGGTVDDTDYYGSVSEFYQRGFRTHSRQNAQRFFGNVGHRFSGSVENRTYVTYVRTDSELPGNLTKAQMKNDPQRANASNVLGDQKRDFNLYRVANKTTIAGGGRRMDVSAYYAHKQLDHPIFQVIDQVSDDIGLTAAVTSVNPLGGRRNRFVAGVTPSIGFTNDERYLNINGGRGAKTSDSDQTSLNAEAFVENQHYVTPKVAIGLGTQFVYAERENDDNFPVTLTDKDNSETQTFSGFSPKLGVRYEINSQNQVFANVARSFEPPTFGELTGNSVTGGLNELDEQTATTFEVGTRGREGHIRWDLSVYHAKVKNELLSLTDANGVALGTINADDTIHQGVETGFDVALPCDVFLRQAYTLNHFKFDDDKVFGNASLAGAPKHVYQAELQYENEKGWYVGPNVEWVPSKFPVDHRNTFYADPYTVFGFKGGFRMAKGLSVFVDVRNITDRLHAASTGVVANANGADSVQFLPGDGRSVFAGLDWNF